MRVDGLPPTTPPIAKAPFDAKQARAHQEAWAKHLGTEVETTNSVGMKMVLIPPGEFMMGSTDEQVEAALADPATKDLIQSHERPQHRVVLTRPLLMAQTELTVAAFRQFVTATQYVTEAEKYGAGGSSSVAEETDPTKRNPLTWCAPRDNMAVANDTAVSQVSWNDAVAFCNWLSEREKLPASLSQTGHKLVGARSGLRGYRLATEAEWEYACLRWDHHTILLWGRRQPTLPFWLV